MGHELELFAEVRNPSDQQRRNGTSKEGTITYCFASIAKVHHQFVAALDKLGSKDPKTQKIRKKICGELMELKLSPKMFDQLIDNLRQHVTEVRLLEKEIMFLCIKQAGMPRKDFISTFPKNDSISRSRRSASVDDANLLKTRTSCSTDQKG